MIRNFRRYSWLLMYLFGAAPALDQNFLRGRPHDLDRLDADTLFLPWATSLRMSDLGYQNNAQSGLTPCYNSLDSYLSSLRQAVSTPYPPYAEIGTKRDGEWVQLNTNVIQIENEYYSSIRPKRVTYTGERPIQALMARGVQYVEVRCLDINPFLPLGIDLAESRFLDAFLLFCALQDSPPLAGGECRDCTDNFQRVVRKAVAPACTCSATARRSASRSGPSSCSSRSPAPPTCWTAPRAARPMPKPSRPSASRSRTPASRRRHRCWPSCANAASFSEFSLRQSRLHAEYFRAQALAPDDQARLEAMARESLEEQARLEAEPDVDFDTFVAAYQASIPRAAEHDPCAIPTP